MEPFEASEYCSASNVQVSTSSIAYSRGEYGIRWNLDGHIYTTLLIADLTNYDVSRQLALAYYSQYPDENADYEATPVAIKYLLIPWHWRWRNDVTGVLHSLHGGDNTAVAERRDAISKALSTSIKNPKQDWLSGLLIHALGDAYAHTANAYGSITENAYGPWIGHAIPSLLHRNPDAIRRPLARKKYLGYVTNLYDVLRQDSSSDTEFAKILDFLAGFECKSDNCGNFHAAYNDSQSDDAMEDFSKCMELNSRDLKRDEVQSAIDSIPR
ncbi:hypothetical protein [Congregibacter litoralis]|nr:hypothetical protein [Congregibacter litoralis]